jgi:hypothetical protein
VAYLLKVRNVKPDETFTPREQLGNIMWLCVIYAVRVTFPQHRGCTQQYRNSWKQCFLCSPGRATLRVNFALWNSQDQELQLKGRNVAYLFKARIVEPEEMSIARKQHDNITWLCVFYAVRATEMHTRIEEQLKVVSSMWSALRLHKESIFSSEAAAERCQPARTGAIGHRSQGHYIVWSRYQAMWPRTLVCVWKWSAMCSHELYECAINPVINPKPIYSHSNMWQYC